jgi:hypothetical protein
MFINKNQMSFFHLRENLRIGCFAAFEASINSNPGNGREMCDDFLFMAAVVGTREAS